MRRLARRILLLMLMACAALSVLSCNDGDGGGGSPTAPIRYVNVTGRWVGIWMADGIVPVDVTMDLGQNGAQVHGSLFMTIINTFFFPDVTGTAGQESLGAGTLTFGVSDSSGSFNVTVTVANGEMNGTARLSASSTFTGPIRLRRTGSAPVLGLRDGGGNQVKELASQLAESSRRP